MKFKARFLSLFLLLCLCVQFLPLTVLADEPDAEIPEEFAEEEALEAAALDEDSDEEATLMYTSATSGTCGDDLTWSFDADTGTLTISGSGAMNNYTLSSTPWYDYVDTITEVVFDGGITSIGNYAFYRCTNLSTVTLPDTLESIGERAFYYCWVLPSINVPANVSSIGEEAFSAALWKLTAITVSAGNAYYSDIDGVLFNADKTELVCYPAGKTGPNYSIPDGVKSIAAYAFEYCKVTNSTIPDSVTSIGTAAFYINHVASITVDANNQYFSSVGGVLFNFDQTELIQYPVAKNEETYEIPATVQTIRSYAFVSSTLISIVMSDNVTNIGESAFEVCTKLERITLSKELTSIKDWAFCNCESLTDIEIPDNVTSIGERAFYYCTSLTEVEIPNSVTSIKDSAFCYCTSLICVEIPDSVTSIGEGAFLSCRSLKYVKIPGSVKTIESHAFRYCYNLARVDIASGVGSIGSCAFNQDSSLSTIVISDSVTTIGYSAFSGCTGLTDVYYSGTKEAWSSIEIDTLESGNEYLTGATIHYESTAPLWFSGEIETDNTGSLTACCSCNITLGSIPSKSVILLAVYNEDNQFVDIATATVTTDDIAADELTITLDQEIKDSYTVKAFATDKDYTPLSVAITIQEGSTSSE